MTSIQLTALPDGPCRLEGDVTTLDRGSPPFLEQGSPASLGRGGRSADKPFCDGPHARTGWWKEDA